MTKNSIDTLLGAVVILIAGIFIYTAYNLSNISKVKDSYILKADFNDTSGIELGSEVKISGILIGKVSDKQLNDNYRATLTFNIDNSIKLPSDSAASIVSSGLLGGKFVSITPGGSDEMLKDNSFIYFTQDSVNLETLLGKFAFGAFSDDKPKD